MALRTLEKAFLSSPGSFPFLCCILSHTESRSARESRITTTRDRTRTREHWHRDKAKEKSKEKMREVTFSIYSLLADRDKLQEFCTNYLDGDKKLQK